MNARKPFWITFIVATLAILAVTFFIRQQSRLAIRANVAKHIAQSRRQPAPPELFESASVSPIGFRIKTGAAPIATPAATPMPSPSPAALATNKSPSTSALHGELTDSQRRIDTIDTLSMAADVLFDERRAGESDWSVNPQGMNQRDYQLGDGTAVTAWISTDGSGANGMLHAQEAQLPNGEVVDRWFNDNGSVQQVMHQYDENHSVSIFYYDNGRVEGMRIIQDGREIYTRFDRDGHLVEKTIN